MQINQFIMPVKNVTAGGILKFAFLPGIMPRLASLAWTFSKFLFCFTQIFGAIGLIEKQHPCLRPENIGRYRFADIIGYAYGNLRFERNYVPQIFMFCCIVLSLVLTFGMILTFFLGSVLFIPKAHAQYFSDSTDPDYGMSNDFAYTFLREVFGNTGSSFWMSAATQGGPPMAPQDVHVIFGPIIRRMFETYSQALMIIAVVMIIYLVVVMVAESARTGEPFGQSFNSVWAPIRLALAFGLLVPISQGYNGAQLLAFQVSHWGSALATNVWIAGLSAFGATADDAAEKLIATIQPPNSGYAFMRTVWMGNVCEQIMNKNGWTTGIGRTMHTFSDSEGIFTYYQVGTSVDTFFAKNADFCGSFKVPEPENFKVKKVYLATGSATPVQIGHLSHLISQRYKELYTPANSGAATIDSLTNAAAAPFVAAIHDQKNADPQTLVRTNANLANLHLNLFDLYRQKLGWEDGKYFNTPAFKAAAKQDGDSLVQILRSGKQYGWASAGSLMMTLANVNNIMSSAVNAPPESMSLPQLMTNPHASPWTNSSNLESNFWSDAFAKFMWNDTETEMMAKSLTTIMKADTWFINRINDTGAGGTTPTGLVLKTTIDPVTPANSVIADINLGEWRQTLKSASAASNGNIDLNNVGGMTSFFLGLVSIEQSNMDPLAGVIAIGGNLAGLAVWIVAAGAAAAAYFEVESIFTSALSIAIPMILAGYMLCVVLPITLFATFMFAVIEWVISVLEAVISMPLWALSFISVGGEGIGDNAMSGVKSLFEIMLRPTVIVIATVGAMIIFSASAHFFNKGFAAFLTNFFNAEGFMKDALMCFGSAFLYAMTMFSIGNSCFKMIPTIANGFGRWMGLPGGFSGTMQADMSQISGLTALYGLQQIGGGIAGLYGAPKQYKDKKKAEKAADTQHEYDKAYLSQQGIDLDQGPNQKPMDSSQMAIYQRAREHKKEKDKKK